MNIEQLIIAKADAHDGLIEWKDFIDICLYSPECGYYRCKRKRAGGNNADFYTSETLKYGVFSEMIYESAKNMLSQFQEDIKDYQIVEIGAEPDNKLACAQRVIRIGEHISIPERCVLVSNELLDAQPFSRFKFNGSEWTKGFLDTRSSPFKEVFFKANEDEIELLEKYMPYSKVNGFRCDISMQALGMFRNIVKAPWRGVIIFADYYRFSHELATIPAGTARTYRNYTLGTDLLEAPGQTDITFSPCSDMLDDIAHKFGFYNVSTDWQGNFFIKNAKDLIESIISVESALDGRKRETAELISPAHMGSSFRILSGVRV